MAAPNTLPIYSKASDFQANTSALINAVAAVLYNASGTIGTDIYKVFQADATNGGYVERVRFKYVANGTTSSNGTVLKVFISSKTSGATTDADTFLFDEVIALATGTLTTTTSGPLYEVPFGFALPAGYTILVKTTVAQPASCGWVATAIAGKY